MTAKRQPPECYTVRFRQKLQMHDTDNEGSEYTSEGNCISSQIGWGYSSQRVFLEPSTCAVFLRLVNENGTKNRGKDEIG